MGLKLLTLAYCTVTGKKVKVHGKKDQKATVKVVYNKKGEPTFLLQFEDGSQEEVVWAADLQGYGSKVGDLCEVEEALQVNPV
jgi:hypothetical protein